MLENRITKNLEKHKKDIDLISYNKVIDCVTIFPKNKDEYEKVNNEMIKYGYIIDKMSSGNLYYLKEGIETIYGKLHFVKIRIFDSSYINYELSVDFTVSNYNDFKNSIKEPVIKIYDTFELIQFKNNNYIINIVSISAKKEYNIN